MTYSRSALLPRLLPLALLAALLVVLPWAGALGGGLAAPQRPASVPKSASWLGGPDGGVFFELSSTDSAKGRNYRGTIWRDHGRVWYRGPFHVQPANSAPVDVKKSKQFAGWDGTRLVIDDGRALVAGKAR